MPVAHVVVALWLCGVLAACSSLHRPAAATSSTQIQPDTLAFFDKTRNRPVPVALYRPVDGPATKLALLSHGYGGKNTEYSFLARHLAARGYLVVSVQHELPGDEPIATTGPFRETRRPNWQRGVQNLLFAAQEFKKREPGLDENRLLLVGHSNGGDTAALFAEQHPERVEALISLDNRRMALPRKDRIRVLTFRSSDQPADPGVLPTAEEARRFHTTVIRMEVRHDDLWDGATENQRAEMLRAVDAFLTK
jgi:dienelactone hydrolase